MECGADPSSPRREEGERQSSCAVEDGRVERQARQHPHDARVDSFPASAPGERFAWGRDFATLSKRMVKSLTTYFLNQAPLVFRCFF